MNTKSTASTPLLIMLAITRMGCLSLSPEPQGQPAALLSSRTYRYRPGESVELRLTVRNKSSHDIEYDEAAKYHPGALRLQDAHGSSWITRYSSRLLEEKVTRVNRPPAEPPPRVTAIKPGASSEFTFRFDSAKRGMKDAFDTLPAGVYLAQVSFLTTRTDDEEVLKSNFVVFVVSGEGADGILTRAQADTFLARVVAYRPGKWTQAYGADPVRVLQEGDVWTFVFKRKLSTPDLPPEVKIAIPSRGGMVVVEEP